MSCVKQGGPQRKRKACLGGGKQRLVPAQRVGVPVKLAGADKEQQLFEDRISNR